MNTSRKFSYENPAIVLLLPLLVAAIAVNILLVSLVWLAPKLLDVLLVPFYLLEKGIQMHPREVVAVVALGACHWLTGVLGFYAAASDRSERVVSQEALREKIPEGGQGM